MLRAVLAVLALFLIAPPADAAGQRAAEPPSAEAVLGWMNQYRFRPEPHRVPAAIRAAGQAGAFKDPESAGVYVGFLAGVLNSNPTRAESIVERILPLPPDQQWALVRAVAWSGLPQWKGLLHAYKMHMPGRAAMIDKFLAGELATLAQLALKKEEERSWLDRLRGKPAAPKAVVLEATPDVIDTLWGFYFATGTYEPVRRLVAMLPWSRNDEDVETLTLGGMVKYTLASNAARNGDLLTMLKWALPHQDERTKPILAEVIAAAETVETAKIRKDAFAAIEDLKRKGPGSRRKIAGWGQISQNVLSLGCIGAAVAGAVALGLPCVIGGALSSAALNAWAAQQD